MLAASLSKDLLLLWRARAQSASTYAFACTLLLALSLAAGPDATALRQSAAGFLWASVLFTSNLLLASTFRDELESGALEAILQLGAAPRALFFSKAIANALLVALVGLALLPALAALFDATTARPLALMGLVLLSAAAISAPGTLFAAIAAKARAESSLLLPLLLLPLLTPVLLASVQATRLLLFGDPMGQLMPWMLLLAAFAALFWPISGLLFGAVLEES